MALAGAKRADEGGSTNGGAPCSQSSVSPVPPWRRPYVLPAARARSMVTPTSFTPLMMPSFATDTRTQGA